MSSKQLNLILLVLALITVLLMPACKSSTAVKSGIISGVIILDGASDHSGVEVSIFGAGVVPPEIKQIQTDYPQLAFPISDREYFDHRDHAALHTVLTDQDGFFELPKLPYGEYILCYLKEGWGYNYIFNLILDRDEMSISANTLYPEQALPSFIDGLYTLQSNRCYTAGSDVLISSNTNLVFQDNSRLLLDSHVKITIQGKISFPNTAQRALVSSRAGIYSGTASESQMGEGLLILGGEGILDNISFSYLRQALKLNDDNWELNNLSFRNCTFGLIVNSVSNVSVEACLFDGNTNINAAAHYAYDVQGLSIVKCLYYNNYIASKNEIVKNAIINNNAFINNSRSYLNFWESTAVFEHNIIYSQGVGIENSGKSNLEISYNDIECKVGVKTYHTNNWYNTPTLGWTKANNNNLVCSQYAVESNARYYYYESDGFPMDFKSNFWGTTDSSAISDKIIDFYDLGNGPDEWCYAEIVYQPFRTNRVTNAGIQ